MKYGILAENNSCALCSVYERIKFMDPEEIAKAAIDTLKVREATKKKIIKATKFFNLCTKAAEILITSRPNSMVTVDRLLTSIKQEMFYAFTAAKIGTSLSASFVVSEICTWMFNFVTTNTTSKSAYEKKKREAGKVGYVQEARLPTSGTKSLADFSGGATSPQKRLYRGKAHKQRDD